MENVDLENSVEKIVKLIDYIEEKGFETNQAIEVAKIVNLEKCLGFIDDSLMTGLSDIAIKGEI